MKKRNNFLLEQTLLANERTLLSYIRTSMAALIFGFGLIQFGSSIPRLINLGYSALAIGIIFILVGLTHYHINKIKILNKD